MIMACVLGSVVTRRNGVRTWFKLDREKYLLRNKIMCLRKFRIVFLSNIKLGRGSCSLTIIFRKISTLLQCTLLSGLMVVEVISMVGNMCWHVFNGSTYRSTC
jgi:hypothetical protein